MSDSNIKEVPVSSHTKPAALGSSIDHFIADGKQVRLRCIGVAAVCNAGIGAVVARRYLAKKRIGLIERPRLVDTQVDGAYERTVIVIDLDTYRK